MNLDSIGRLVNDFLRSDELSSRKIILYTIFGERHWFAAGCRHHCRQWWTLCSGADICDVFAVAGDERCPLESFAGRQHHGLRARDGNFHDVTAIDVIAVSAGVSAKEH